MKWENNFQRNSLYSKDNHYVIKKNKDHYELYIHNFFSDDEFVDKNEDLDKLKDSAKKHKNKINRQNTCKHCNKKKQNHRAHDFACPLGGRGRVGFTSFYDGQFFESKE